MNLEWGYRGEKTEENKFGWYPIEDEDIDLSYPVVFALSGNSCVTEASANGFAKITEEMLGINDLAPEEKPCRVYSVYYKTDKTSVPQSSVEVSKMLAGIDMDTIIEDKAKKFNKSENERKALQSIINRLYDMIEEAYSFVDNVLLKIVIKDGKKLDATEAAKRARNVNILSFCYGCDFVNLINFCFNKRLKEIGYSDEEIELLESQIAQIQCAPVARNSQTKESIVNFGSMHDAKFETSEYLKALPEEIIDSLKEIKTIGKFEVDNSTLICIKQFTQNPIPEFEEDDEDYLDENGLLDLNDELNDHMPDLYLRFQENWMKTLYNYAEGGVLPVCVTLALRRAVQNSIKNSSRVDFTPITSEFIVEPCVPIVDSLESGRISSKSLAEKMKNSLDKYSVHPANEKERKL